MQEGNEQRRFPITLPSVAMARATKAQPALNASGAGERGSQRASIPHTGWAGNFIKTHIGGEIGER